MARTAPQTHRARYTAGTSGAQLGGVGRRVYTGRVVGQVYQGRCTRAGTLGRVITAGRRNPGLFRVARMTTFAHFAPESPLLHTFVTFAHSQWRRAGVLAGLPGPGITRNDQNDQNDQECHHLDPLLDLLLDHFWTTFARIRAPGRVSVTEFWSAIRRRFFPDVVARRRA